MDISRCAQILFATFGHLSPQKAKEADFVAALAELAKAVYQLDGEGFSAPRPPQPQERTSEVWRACVAAATQALDPAGKPKPPVGVHVVVWAPDKNDAKKPDPSIPLVWPLHETPKAVFGPFEDKATKSLVSIFVYDAIDVARALTEDGDANPGAFPRRLLSGLGGAVRAKHRQGRRFLSLVLFAVGILLLLFSTMWTWFAADFNRSALRTFKGSIEGAAGDVSTVCLGRAAADDKKLAWTTSQDTCDAAWARHWTARQPKAVEEIGYDWIRYKLWPGIDVRGNFSLLRPLLLNMAGIVLLVFAAGLAVNGLWFGAFLDKHNRISLAGFQLAAWSIVIFGGYSALAVFNAGMLAQDIRDAAQLGTGTAVGNVFPSMAWELWLTLGIVLGGPAVAVLINNRKETPGEERLELTAMSVPEDPLVSRASADEASLADLFMGESEGNEGHVDISRLQHLAITLLLLSTYLILLLEYVRTIGGLQIADAVGKASPVFAAMPPVDPTFVALLAVSHAAYLGFKTIPKK